MEVHALRILNERPGRAESIQDNPEGDGPGGVLHRRWRPRGHSSARDLHEEVQVRPTSAARTSDHTEVHFYYNNLNIF